MVLAAGSCTYGTETSNNFVALSFQKVGVSWTCNNYSGRQKIAPCMILIVLTFLKPNMTTVALSRTIVKGEGIKLKKNYFCNKK